MSERRDGRRERPGGLQIVSWAAIVFGGLLAFVNSATIATSVEMRVFLIVAGVALIAIFLTLLGRWYWGSRGASIRKGR